MVSGFLFDKTEDTLVYTGYSVIECNMYVNTVLLLQNRRVFPCYRIRYYIKQCRI
ncbi:hypothetical protein C817_03039 [Dorea sp. 5-2]|nr:hypothetical protein C817_03039 [Dorea sp. 5-2]